MEHPDDEQVRKTLQILEARHELRQNLEHAFGRVKVALPAFAGVSDFERRRRVVLGAIVNAVVDAALDLTARKEKTAS